MPTVGTESNSKLVVKGKLDTPNTITRPLVFLAWYRHFNKKWRN